MADFHLGLRRARRYWITLLGLLLLISACTRVNDPTAQPVPPSRVTPASTVATHPLVTLTLEPTAAISETITPSPTESPTPLSPLALTQTQEEAEAQAYVATQLATLDMPTGTPTPCASLPCTTPMPTRTPYRSRTPTLTPTPSLPIAALHVVKPGPLSKVTSPIHLEAIGYTGLNGTINVELIGEDGRPIFRQVVIASIAPDQYQAIAINIEFQISGVAEAARLQVSTYDFYGREVALSSVDLILLSIGEEQVNPADDGISGLIIKNPKAEEVVKGGTLTVKGLARPLNDSPIALELITDDGKMVGSRQVTLAKAPEGSFVPFQVDLPYTVTQLRNVRLIASQQGTRIPGTALLSSVRIWLRP